MRATVRVFDRNEGDTLLDEISSRLMFAKYGQYGPFDVVFRYNTDNTSIVFSEATIEKHYKKWLAENFNELKDWQCS